MTVTLIIARHGNTFNDGDTPTRVGARTDLPLVSKGEEQARALGKHLLTADLIPDVIYTSELQRTRRTAQLATAEMGVVVPSSALPFLNEIDYGPDENQTDDVVKQRIGEEALKNWDKNATMPDEWSPRPETIIGCWEFFLKKCVHELQNKKILVVTSNGIARFALNCTTNGNTFPLKLSTGSYGLLHYRDQWIVSDWNIRPQCD